MQRTVRPAQEGGDNPEDGGGAHRPVYPLDFRTIDGRDNNALHPSWGSAGTTLVRSVLPAYGDGVGTPSGADRPSPRDISNIVCPQLQSHVANSKGVSDFLWQWGQFLDHDITETPITDPHEAFDVAVPMGDAWFDPDATGTKTIPLDRSAWTMVDGVRQQYNNITAYIDASNVYGSEEHRCLELRTLDGTGRLKMTDDGMMPFNVNGLDNAPTSGDPSYFLGGDIRANEQVVLTAMHTLFVREHNRLAARFGAEDPTLSGEEIFQRARAYVGAEMQAITYNEFLPRLLGADAIPPYTGYNPDVDAGIANVFATAAYRVGHTMLSTEVLRLDRRGYAVRGGHLDLASAFFNPGAVLAEGIEPVLRGLAMKEAQEIDMFVVDDVRNFLFGPPGAGGFDLVSLNIQRGRDHGLPSYNAVRVAYGLEPVASFSEISPDPAVDQALAIAYGSVDDIDPWIGFLAESHRDGSMVSETLCRVLIDQFTRLRDGDRFWYELYLPQELIDEVESLTLGDIIRLNTTITDEIGRDVFMAPERCGADFALPYGVMNLDDVMIFLDRFAENNTTADLDMSGSLDISDVLLFLDLFVGDCGG